AGPGRCRHCARLRAGTPDPERHASDPGRADRRYLVGRKCRDFAILCRRLRPVPQRRAGQMTVDYEALEFSYTRSPDQAPGAALPRHPVIVVGAGPVGLAAAIDLAQRGLPVLLLDDDGKLSTGSRAICFAKRSLEIFDRLGCGDPMVEKGISWQVGKVFF